jgi:hypothetical protein
MKSFLPVRMDRGWLATPRPHIQSTGVTKRCQRSYPGVSRHSGRECFLAELLFINDLHLTTDFVLC